ncbi:hypothetical protein [Paraburkholderia sp. RL17-373-BIF-A]|uniref:hypothetical protein n=1 Tax=Paraburkholderia sp. RL17-373-BIF-A TaxID=3031629 RepID=UPI0038BBC1B4
MYSLIHKVYFYAASGGESDPKRVKYDANVMDAIDTKRKRAELYDRYLSDYGFGGIEPVNYNLPWKWETDPAKQAAAKGALNWVTHTDSDLKGVEPR